MAISERFISISRLLSRRILAIHVITFSIAALLIIALASTLLQEMVDAYFMSNLYGANESLERRLGRLSTGHIYSHFRRMDAMLNTFNPLFPDNVSRPEDKSRWPHHIVIDSIGIYVYYPDSQRIGRGNFFDDIQQTSPSLRRSLTQALAAGKTGQQSVTFCGQSAYIYYMPLENVGWSNAIVVPTRIKYMPIIVIGLILLTIISLGLIASLRVSLKIIRRVTSPLRLLTRSANEVARGNFQFELPVIWRNTEIRQLRDSFANMQQSLVQYIDQLKTETTHKATIVTELNIARDIQLSMVPSMPPQLSHPRLDLYAMMSPARDVGGDLYDFFLRDNRLFFCIGDACDKGIPAAMFMTATINLFRAYASEDNAPHTIVSLVNNSLCRNTAGCMFVTLFVGILDLDTGCLQYCNAGHNVPILIHQTVELLPFGHHPAVGAFSDIAYTTQQIDIAPHTTLLLYTDGLNEATRADGTMFGEARIFSRLNQAICDSSLSPKSIIDGMSQTVHSFVGGNEQSDDLTMLCLRMN